VNARIHLTGKTRRASSSYRGLARARSWRLALDRVGALIASRERRVRIAGAATRAELAVSEARL
jgi:hypothetical protein